MMIQFMPAETHPPLATIRVLIARHGAWRVLAAVVAASLRRDPAVAPPPVAHLSDHVRRDIGLAPLPPPRPQIWHW